MIMAKKLMLIRHANSKWDFNTNDFERPLSEQGFMEATELCESLRLINLVPSHVVTSSAKRALTTAQIFAASFGVPNKKIETIPALYHADSKTLLATINELSDEHDFIALIGHNPGISVLAKQLIDYTSFDFPTCGIALIKFEDAASWKEISKGTGTLLHFLYPEKLL